MLELYEENKRDCIRLLNMIICEIPFIRSFSDDCLLERLLNLISIITNNFETTSSQSFDCNALESEAEREASIREWLLRHYNAKCFIDELDFNDSEDRTRVAILIINILFKLRHSLKDIEQYLKDIQTFIQFDQQLNHITRFDKLLELVENDLNKWKSEARCYKVKLDECKKQIVKYQQNEIFNYNISPRNQNLYKSRISLDKSTNESSVLNTTEDNNIKHKINDRKQSTDSLEVNNTDKELNNGFISEEEFNENIVNNVNVSHQCVECDKNYCTNYEYNLHILKDHKNVDISDIIKNSHLVIDINNINSINNNLKNSKKCKIQKKRTFKCNYNKCGKAFYKSDELKKHFDKHQPKIHRHMYINNANTNSVLNHLRNPISKPRRVSISSNKSKKIKNNFNNNINKNISFNGKDMSFTERTDMNEFDVDSRLNNCNVLSDSTLSPVPYVCQNFGPPEFNGSIDSCNFFNESTDEEIDSNATEMDINFGVDYKQNSKPNGSSDHLNSN